MQGTSWRFEAAQRIWVVLSIGARIPARVEVLESADGDFEVVESSHPVLRRDAKSFAFEVDVPARGAVKVTYRVRVRWC